MAFPNINGQEWSERQLPLPLGHDMITLRCFFERAAGAPVSLALTENSVTMVSAKKKEGRIFLRLHRIFLEAGKEVLDEISAFVMNGRTETPSLRKFIKESTACLPEKKPSNRPMRTEGRYHDLGGIYETVNTEYFGGKISCLITWGKVSPRRAVRKRTLGSYSRQTGTIRINPVLDKKAVPRSFVEFVVYHEMLHADIGVIEKNGRRSVHSKEFRRRERLFRKYREAVAWEKERGWLP